MRIVGNEGGAGRGRQGSGSRQLHAPPPGTHTASIHRTIPYHLLPAFLPAWLQAAVAARVEAEAAADPAGAAVDPSPEAERLAAEAADGAAIAAAQAQQAAEQVCFLRGGAGRGTGGRDCRRHGRPTR